MTNISASDFQFISPSEFRILETKFNDYANSDEISFEDFKEILSSSSKINKEILLVFLEKIKKKLRDSTMHSDSDHISKFLILFQLKNIKNRYL
jgi:hypothetical protein